MQLVFRFDSPAKVVGYGYSEITGGNHSRPTTLTYPSSVNNPGTTLSYSYGTDPDNAISRLASLTLGATVVEEYAYLGLGAVVERTRPYGQVGRGGYDVGLTYREQPGDPAPPPAAGAGPAR